MNYIKKWPKFLVWFKTTPNQRPLGNENKLGSWTGFSWNQIRCDWVFPLLCFAPSLRVLSYVLIISKDFEDVNV